MPTVSSCAESAVPPAGSSSSVRWEATREGAEDYEMFKIAAQIDPEAARTLCASCFTAFDDVNYDPLAYRAARERLIELAGRAE